MGTSQFLREIKKSSITSFCHLNKSNTRIKIKKQKTFENESQTKLSLPLENKLDKEQN